MSTYVIGEVSTVTFACQSPMVKKVSRQWMGEPSSLLKHTSMWIMLERSKLLKDERLQRQRQDQKKGAISKKMTPGCLEGCEMLDTVFYFPFQILVYLLLLSALTGRHSDWIIYFFLTYWSTCCYFYLCPTWPLCQSVAAREQTVGDARKQDVLDSLLSLQKSYFKTLQASPWFLFLQVLLFLILSFLHLANKGKCSYCSTSVSPHVPLIYFSPWRMHITLRRRAGFQAGL